MKILYDHQIFTYQRFGGISRYFAELMRYSSSIPELEYALGVKESANESLKNTGLSDKHAILINDRKDSFLSLSKKYIKNDLYTRMLIRQNQFDIFHPTFFFPGLTRKLRNKPFVVTIMDMIPELFPEMYPKDTFYSKNITHRWIEGKKELVANADAIIAISEKTKIDLIDMYGVNADKVKVIYLGNSLDMSTIKEVSPDIKLPDKYLLFVGSRYGYKNFKRFFNAGASLMSDDDQLHILCVGGGAFSDAERAMISEQGVSSRVHQCNVTDDELCMIYKKAMAFVFPSMYEGFGIPIVEAFNMNCPVLLSNASCFPEIAGNAAAYFNPEDVESIAQTLKIIYDESGLKTLRNNGKNRRHMFTWQKTIEQTSQVYQSVL